MNIIDIIKARRSVRSFDGKGLTDQQKAGLLKAVDDSWSPFGGSVTIRLKSFDLGKGYKPSTYGMITGAEDFFLVGFGSDGESALSAGFRFEQVVLKAWEMGLGTCWIAATFKDSDFERGESWPDGEELKIVSPAGVAAKPSLMEKLTRMAVGSKNRKPFDRLFFFGDFNTVLPVDSRFAVALEMMRLAPSSTNSQPWRALVVGYTVHFYYKPKSRISVLDCGIGLCHFIEAERYHHHQGTFGHHPDAPAPPSDWKYLTSYTLSAAD